MVIDVIRAPQVLLLSGSFLFLLIVLCLSSSRLVLSIFFREMRDEFLFLSAWFTSPFLSAWLSKFTT